MTERTDYQKKLIRRYYQRRDDIMAAKLSELVGELYLADSDRKRDRLWQRAEAAMRNLKWPESLISHLLTKRSPEALAANLKEWLGEGR